MGHISYTYVDSSNGFQSEPIKKKKEPEKSVSPPRAKLHTTYVYTVYNDHPFEPQMPDTLVRHPAAWGFIVVR